MPKRAHPSSALAVLAALFLSGLCLSAHAAENYKALEPLLVDQPGWQSEEPQGTSIESAGQTMIQASRRYAKGDSEVTALLIYGSKMTSSALGGNANIDTE